MAEGLNSKIMTRFDKNFFVPTFANYVSLLFAVLVLVQARYGLDLTDESFCLITISNPDEYLGLSLFGHLLHPLYTIIGGNVVALRQINSLFTLSLSCLLFGVFLSTRLAGRLTRRMSLAAKATLAATLGSSAYASLTFMGCWLQTPTYNSLTLDSLIAIFAGLIFSQNRRTAAKYTGLALIGVGIWLLMAAKISTAAIAITFVCTFFLAYRRDVHALVVCGATSVVSWVLFIYLKLKGWPIPALYYYIIESFRVYKTLVGQSSISNIVRMDTIQTSYAPLWTAFAVGVLFALFSNSRVKVRRVFSRSTTRATGLVVAHAMSLVSLATVALALLLQYNVIDNSWPIQAIARMALDWLLFLFIFFGVLVVEIHFAVREKVFPNTLRFALVCLFIPAAIAFGSNVNYWQQSTIGCIFWVLGTTCLLLKSRSNLLLQSFAALVQFLVLAVIVHASHNPFMQSSPLYRMTGPISIERTSSQLFVSEESYIYLAQFKQIAAAAGFVPGTRILSLTGSAPGALYVLGGDIPGAPWLFGHPTYNRYQYAQRILQRISPGELKKAWVLVEYDSEYALPVSLLHQFDLSLERDYQLAGTILTPKTGYTGAREQYLFRPK